jgi:hypothetical protein
MHNNFQIWVEPSHKSGWKEPTYLNPRLARIATHWGSSIPKITQLWIQKYWCRKPAQRWTLKQNWSHYQLTSGQSNFHRKEIMQNTATQTSLTIQEPNMRNQISLRNFHKHLVSSICHQNFVNKLWWTRSDKVQEIINMFSMKHFNKHLKGMDLDQSHKLK